jgi:hypothetical protein
VKEEGGRRGRREQNLQKKAAFVAAYLSLSDKIGSRFQFREIVELERDSELGVSPFFKSFSGYRGSSSIHISDERIKPVSDRKRDDQSIFLPYSDDGTKRGTKKSF